MKRIKLYEFELEPRILRFIVFTIVTLLVVALPVSAQESTESEESPLNIVLVHGAWADGSSWSKIIDNLQGAGYNVVAPQLPHTSLADNVTKLHHVMSRLEGPILLVGHSYGGQVITAGGNMPDVVGLVYVAAFGLDNGESIGGLLEGAPPTPALAHLSVDELGFAWLPQEDFVTHFANDVDPVEANIMYAVQQPLHISALADVVESPAWANLPSWYVIATLDEAIPPPAQHLFAERMGATILEIESGHVAMWSHSDEVANFIIEAAQSLSTDE